MVEFKDKIQQSIDYIEDNLQEEIALADCAETAGYSLFHYCRLFRTLTGISVMDYLRKRRLAQASIELVETRKSITTICFDYGFNSHENFVRAFKREFYVTPSAYRHVRSSLPLVQRLDLDTITFKKSDHPEITPRLVTKPGFMLVGYSIRTIPGATKSQVDAPKHWNRYHAEHLADTIPHGLPASERYDIGMMTDFNLENDELTYLIGVEVDPGVSVEPPLEARWIPSMEYAVFSTPPANKYTFVKQIHRTWDYIFQYWLVHSGYEHAGKLEFETYCEASETYSEDIYIPIIRR
jgi:AraC family transcriptional regulator